MSFEGFDEWDEKFLDQAIRLEEEVISTRNATQATPAIPPSHPHAHDSAWDDVSFSPPRELSQRFSERPESDSFPEMDCEVVEQWRPAARTGTGRHAGGGKEKEIERLKRELGRVSKQLNHLEHECMELKKDRDKKDGQLKSAFSQLEAKDAEIHSLKKTNAEYEASTLQLHRASTSIDQVGTGFPISGPWAREGTSKRLSRNIKNSFEHDSTRTDIQMDGLSAVSELKRRILIDSDTTTSNGCPIPEIIFPETSQPKCTKAIGIQTDLVNDCCNVTTRNECAQHDLSNTLLAIWDSTSDKQSERNLVSKLLMTCASDFYVLFRCMSVSSKITLESLADESFSDVTLHDRMQPVHSVEAAKVSHLQDVLTKINNGMLQLDVLLEALLDLCILKNCTLLRDNVVITYSQNPNILEEKKKADTGVQFSESWDEAFFTGLLSSATRSFDVKSLGKKGNEGFCGSTSISSMHWISLFETMQQILVGNTEECIRVEATFVMNLILMRSNPNKDRVKFGSIPLFGCLSRLLRKEAGLCVQKQAVCLLFLLLNCPKLLMMFCTGDKDGIEYAEAVDVPKDAPALQGRFSSILEGLAECVTCKGNGPHEVQLRRHAIVVVAFIASSGKSGFEILLKSSLPKGICFLELIVEVLASEMDAEAADLAESHDLCKERTLLMREALILLNRLASNPVYSAVVLGVLTHSRATASLTIGVADRISRKGRGCQHFDGMKRTHMEAEIVNLSRVFRTRVFSFLTGSGRVTHGSG
ncbi:protein SENSITIVE TO UV 2 isoform X2 [Magnolia sinica]|uniref:protein SENSITIVE TO UV 2 isoform X2 n=1 Tax=Magnolia sinica TaxID=86752 RepID=UPI0026593AAA|nr:protein SENSITIVE TO UV 2 isoform X2 [Magnolia sinica]